MEWCGCWAATASVALGKGLQNSRGFGTCLLRVHPLRVRPVVFLVLAVPVIIRLCLCPMHLACPCVVLSHAMFV
jgi:hypothetical protein